MASTILNSSVQGWPDIWGNGIPANVRSIATCVFGIVASLIPFVVLPDSALDEVRLSFVKIAHSRDSIDLVYPMQVAQRLEFHVTASKFVVEEQMLYVLRQDSAILSHASLLLQTLTKNEEKLRGLLKVR